MDHEWGSLGTSFGDEYLWRSVPGWLHILPKEGLQRLQTMAERSENSLLAAAFQLQWLVQEGPWGIFGSQRIQFSSHICISGRQDKNNLDVTNPPTQELQLVTHTLLLCCFTIIFWVCVYVVIYIYTPYKPKPAM